MIASFRVLLTAIVLSVLFFAGGSSLAQDEEGGIALPLAPDPARCMIEPRPLAEVREIWEGTIASPVPAPEPIPAELHGAPTDEATVAVVTKLLVDVLACAANGNDGLRDASFLTDEHLRDNVTGLTEEEFNEQYTETPVSSDPEHWIILYAVHNVELLDDGRIKVNPDVIVPGVGHFIDTLLLEEVGGVWLIDQSQDGEGNLYPVTAMTMATPAP